MIISIFIPPFVVSILVLMEGGLQPGGSFPGSACFRVSILVLMEGGLQLFLP